MARLNTSLITKPACIFLLLLLAVLIFKAWNHGVAYVYQYQTISRYRQWSRDDYHPSLQEWERLEAKMLSAVSLEPGEASYENELGLLYRLRADQLEGEASEKLRFRQKALARFKKAIHLRPAWALVWANIVETKALLGELDGEFYFAFDRALALGPNESSVKPTMIETGLAYLDQLRQPYRLKIIQYSVEAAQAGRRKPWLRKLLLRINRLEMICRQLPESKANAWFCRLPKQG
jgi:tetratricopeptide (TPR) repeat protein